MEPFSTPSLPSSDCSPSIGTVDTHKIAFWDKDKNLGFILDSNLTMKQHIVKVCPKKTPTMNENASDPSATTLQKMQQKLWLHFVYDV